MKDDIFGFEDKIILELFLMKQKGNPESFEFQIGGKLFLCQRLWIEQDEFLNTMYNPKNRLITFSVVIVTKSHQHNLELLKTELKKFVQTFAFLEETSLMMSQDLNIMTEKLKEFGSRVMHYPSQDESTIISQIRKP